MRLFRKTMTYLHGILRKFQSENHFLERKKLNIFMNKDQKLENVSEMNDETLTPSQYFDTLKECKKTLTSETLKESYEIFLKLGEKYARIGQIEALKKLCFLGKTLQKEEKLLEEIGVTTFVYRDVVEDYIENIAGNAVKIIELSRYTREIPDELLETIEKSKEIFDELYVVFTDYTGLEERKIEKERRDKDPILFGIFKEDSYIADRFYYLGDWVDEYCDLTLDKMLEKYKSSRGYDPLVTTRIPKTSQELINLLGTYRETVEGTYKALGNPPKKSFFDKIKSIFKKGWGKRVFQEK